MQHVRRPCRLPSAHMVNLMGFLLDNLYTVIPGAVAGRYQRPSTSFSPHSVVLGRIYI